jgi:hypothetical protein
VDRDHRDRLSGLVDQAANLEDLARKIQAEPDDDAARCQLRQLEDEYLTWHSTVITLLPEDLREEFIFEYQGTFFQSRIRHFVQSGREENVLWSTASDTTRQVVSQWQYPFNEAFRGPLLAQKRLILNAVARYGASGDTLNALSLLERIFRNLPFAIATLGRSVRGRSGITVSDEYDLQRIVLAVLQLHFQDVREEDFNPTYAGSATRIDFVLREVRIAVETKMTRPSLTTKKLGDDLAADILRYRKHEDVGALLALVYDPDRRISNPVGFEHDLFSDADQLIVRALIVQ